MRKYPVKKKTVEKVAVLEAKPKVVEIPKAIAETKPAETRLICNYCGGELLLLRKTDNQIEYTCTKCHRGLAIC